MARKSMDQPVASTVINMVTNQPVTVSTREYIGQHIRYYRAKLGMQQQDLAAALGLAKASVCAWETGHTSPDVNNIKKLCEVLKVSPSKLFGRFDEITSQDEEFLNLFHQLDGAEKTAVRDLITGLIAAQ